MRLLVAIDSFKGSATSKELNEALLAGIHHQLITEKISVPIADGGEGTLAALYESLGGAYISVEVTDLLGNMTEVDYLLTEIAGEKTAVIESAAVVGIDRIDPDETTIRKASTYGLGVLLKKIIAGGVTNIYLTLGGSGTSDGGLGLLAGLGAKGIGDGGENALYTFTDIQLGELPKLFQKVRLSALADVTNPYVGTRGFAKVFGSQKGATPQQIKEMELLASQAISQLEAISGQSIANTPGAGAAGGLGGAILALGGKIEAGFATISELIGLEQKIQAADLVITGEGRMDGQTEHGKVPYGVACLAKAHQKPIFALVGAREADIGELSSLLLGAFSIHLGPITLEEAMDKARTLRHLQITGNQLVQVFLKGAMTDD